MIGLNTDDPRVNKVIAFSSYSFFGGLGVVSLRRGNCSAPRKCCWVHPLPKMFQVVAVLSKNKEERYLDYKISVTQLKEPKGNGDIQAAKRD